MTLRYDSVQLINTTLAFYGNKQISNRFLSDIRGLYGPVLGLSCCQYQDSPLSLGRALQQSAAADSKTEPAAVKYNTGPSLPAL